MIDSGEPGRAQHEHVKEMEDPRDAKEQARKDHEEKATKHHVDYLKMLDNKQVRVV